MKMHVPEKHASDGGSRVRRTTKLIGHIATGGLGGLALAAVMATFAAALSPQTITFNNPGAQNFGTTPTLTATAW